jgi:tetratricopeptide (TPR) repeat protein
MKIRIFFIALLSVSNFAMFSQTEDEARELMRQYRYHEAILLLRQLPETRENLLLKAESNERLFNHSAAVEIYEKLLADYPDDLSLLILLAEATWRMGNPDVSLSYWITINELSPDNLFFQTRRAMAHHRASDWQGTIEASRKVFEQDTIPLLLRFVGDAHLNLGNSEGIFYFQYAIVRNPADHLSVLRLGNFFYSLEFFEQTVIITENFLQNVNPNHRAVGQLNGMALYSSGAFDRAIERLKTNVELGDSSFTTTYFLGMSYYASRLFFDATKWLGMAYEMATRTDVNLLFHLGSALILTYDRERGIAILQEGVAHIETQNEMLFDFDVSFATAHLRSNRPSRAIEYFQSALRRRPDSPMLLYNIANTYDNMNEHQSAVIFYERFLRTAPDDFNFSPAEGERISSLDNFYILAHRRLRELRAELFMRVGE